MPHIWNGTLVVTKEELIPEFFNTLIALQVKIWRNKDNDNGIKQVQRSGLNRPMLIDFYSLPDEIQKSFGEKFKKNPIFNFFDFDINALHFFNKYRFNDGTRLPKSKIEEYTINASILIAGEKLRLARIIDLGLQRKSTRGILQTICKDIHQSNIILKSSHGIQHTIPESYRAFDRIYKPFINGVKDNYNYESLISGKFKNQNRRNGKT